MNTNALLLMAASNVCTNLGAQNSAGNFSHPALWQGWPVNAASQAGQMVLYSDAASVKSHNTHPQPLSVHNTAALSTSTVQPNLMLNQSLDYPGNPLTPHSGVKYPTGSSSELYSRRPDRSPRELSEAELYDLCYPNRDDTSRPFYPPVRRRHNDIPKDSTPNSHRSARYSPYARPGHSEPGNHNSARTHLRGGSMAMPFGAMTVGEGLADKNRVMNILKLLQGSTAEARITYVCRDFERGVAVLNDSGLSIKSRFSVCSRIINKAFDKAGSYGFMGKGKSVRGELQIDEQKLGEYIDRQPCNAFRNHQLQANHIETIPIHIKVCEFPEEQTLGFSYHNVIPCV